MELDERRLEREIQLGVGEQIEVRSIESSDHIVGMEALLRKTRETACLQASSDSNRVLVEVAPTPSYFEWAVISALVRLGGETNQPIPRFAEKKLADLSFWERLQVRERIFGWQGR